MIVFPNEGLGGWCLNIAVRQQLNRVVGRRQSSLLSGAKHMLWVPEGLVVGIVGFALEVRAESSAQYNCFTCSSLFVEVRCLIFIRCSFFPTRGEDVDVASVVYCHFRQVCVSVNRRVFVVVILCVACLSTWFYTKVSTVQRNNRCSSIHLFDLCFD